MKNRWLLVFFALLISGRAFANHPNIIIFILDDVGQQDVGVFGNSAVRTPNIDRLAAEGMRFDNAFLTTSSCSPSRASIITGLYPSATGAPNLDDPLSPDKTNLPQLLRQAGYYTASIGKWHLGEEFKSQFDRVVEPREESGAADWLPELARRPKDKPFFFWLASKDAHEPYYWNPPLLRQDPAKVIMPYYAEDNAFTRQVMAGYYDEIARADENIGRVVGQLRAENLLDNTFIIVLSDNGAQIGGSKTTLYDEGIKTPLVIYFPKATKNGAVNKQLVSSVDLMPTLLELAGLPSVKDTPGVSLLPTMHNPEQAVRYYIYAERNRHGAENFERSVRTNRYLYKRNYLGRRLCDPFADSLFEPNKPRDAVYEEFYDVRRDPSAMKNIVSDPEYRNDINNTRQLLASVMTGTTQQRQPPLIMEQCKLRPMNERIRWPFQN